MIPPFRAYLFDVDGTLLDSAGDICTSVREALSEAGVTGLEERYLRSFVGFHLFDLFEQVLPHYTRAQNEALLARYRQIYLAKGHSGTRPYDGVGRMLGSLAGLKSTATTKSTETVRGILTQFGLAGFFDHIQGTDGIPCKPAPDVLLLSLTRFGLRPEEVLMVGDSAPDIAAGRAAGVRTCAVTWGYGNHDHMRALQPDFWIDHPSQLA